MGERFKLGKLEAVRPYGLSDLAVYAQGKLPAPPDAVNYSTGLTLPLDGNGEYGDCVMAATAHLIEAWDNEVHESDAIPTEDQVVKEYFVLTGGADGGLNEADVLRTWHQHGLFGHKIAGYAPVHVKDIIAIHQAIAFFGGALFGIQVPMSAQTQFQNNEPWTYDPSSPIEGGHAIAPLGYDAHHIYCSTWGGIAAVTYPFLSAYLDEAWCIIGPEFVEAGRGPSLDLATLQSDLARL